MRKIKKSIGILLFVIVQYTFGQFFHRTIKGKEELVQKEFKVQNFSKLKMRGYMDFFLVKTVAKRLNSVFNLSFLVF